MSKTASIEGVTLTPLRQIDDARGAVLHMLRVDAPDFTSFGECYFSEVATGAIKGWKRHRRQTQNFAVPVGRVRIVIYDAREDSPTRGCLNVIELGRPERYQRLRIPPGVWYGFRGLGSTPSLIANCTDMPHDPGEGEALALDGLDERRALGALCGDSEL